MRAAVLLSNPRDLPSLFDGGVGAPVIGISAGMPPAEAAPPHRRAAGLVSLTGLAVWALAATDVGGLDLAPTTPRVVWRLHLPGESVAGGLGTSLAGPYGHRSVAGDSPAGCSARPQRFRG